MKDNNLLFNQNKDGNIFEQFLYIIEKPMPNVSKDVENIDKLEKNDRICTIGFNRETKVLAFIAIYLALKTHDNKNLFGDNIEAEEILDKLIYDFCLTNDHNKLELLFENAFPEEIEDLLLKAVQQNLNLKIPEYLQKNFVRLRYLIDSRYNSYRYIIYKVFPEIFDENKNEKKEGGIEFSLGTYHFYISYTDLIDFETRFLMNAGFRSFVPKERQEIEYNAIMESIVKGSTGSSFSFLVVRFIDASKILENFKN